MLLASSCSVKNRWPREPNSYRNASKVCRWSSKQRIRSRSSRKLKRVKHARSALRSIKKSTRRITTTCCWTNWGQRHGTESLRQYQACAARVGSCCLTTRPSILTSLTKLSTGKEKSTTKSSRTTLETLKTHQSQIWSVMVPAKHKLKTSTSVCPSSRRRTSSKSK